MLNLKGGFCRNPRNPSRSATGKIIVEEANQSWAGEYFSCSLMLAFSYHSQEVLQIN